MRPDHLRHAIAVKAALAVIPNNPRALKYPLDKHLYCSERALAVAAYLLCRVDASWRQALWQDHHTDR
jgi:hypothetical protein